MCCLIMMFLLKFLSVSNMASVKNAFIISFMYHFMLPDASMCHGILLVPYQIREPISVLLVQEGQQAPDCPKPTIVLRQGKSLLDTNAFDIILNGIHICSASTFTRAIGLLLAVYHVFNVSSPAKGQATLTFVHKVFLNVQDKVKANDKVTTLLGRLSRVRSLP